MAEELWQVPDDDLAELLRRDAQGTFDLADAGFSAAVVAALPAHAPPASVDIVPWFYIAAISICAALVVGGLGDFVTAMAQSAWWREPQVWLPAFLPFFLLSWLSLAFTRELNDGLT